MLIKDLTNNFEKSILGNHIQHIDCQKSSHPKYVWQYTVWTDTFCHVFKTENRITPDSYFSAIETYTFTIQEAKEKLPLIFNNNNVNIEKNGNKSTSKNHI